MHIDGRAFLGGGVMGFFSGIKKIGKAIVSGVDSIINTAGEILGRLTGLPGFLLDLFIPWP